MDLAFAVAEARQAAKLSQAELVRRIGTSPAMVARWETGKAAPTTISLRRVAEATGDRLRIEFAFERD
ncbi:helix-turn-helix transcriptional regulator [Methylobacterium aquaticum]|nr:helix-turn-helix transcriptional regulator [Methylobacterium aquaticum]